MSKARTTAASLERACVALTELFSKPIKNAKSYPQI